MPSLY